MEFTDKIDRVCFVENGKTVAEVTFQKRSEDVVEIDHTFVHDSMRGQGIAGKLMQRLSERLRREKKKAVPVCSYAVKWFEKHDEYKDVLFIEP